MPRDVHNLDTVQRSVRYHPAAHALVCDGVEYLHIEFSQIKGYCVESRCHCSALRVRVSQYVHSYEEAEKLVESMSL